MGNSYDRRLEKRVKEREMNPKSKNPPVNPFPRELRVSLEDRRRHSREYGLDTTLCGYMRLPCWNGDDKTQIYGLCAYTNQLCYSKFPMGRLEGCTVHQKHYGEMVSSVKYFDVNSGEPLRWEFIWREEKVIADIYFKKSGKNIYPYVRVEGSYRPRSKTKTKKRKKESATRKFRKVLTPIQRPEKIKSDFFRTYAGRDALSLLLYGALSSDDYKRVSINLNKRNSVRVRRRL
jgi:hypothetical protein